MNKKLLAVAVAGALAAPGVALAQTSVTISGMIKVSADNISYSGATSVGQNGPAPAGATGIPGRAGNTSENRLADNSSRIIFGIREDLGNGLAAVAQIDQRFNPTTASEPNGGSGIGDAAKAGGNSWVGLQSTTWGKLTFGRHDLHYGKSGDSWNSGGAGSLQAWSAGVFDYIARPVAATATAPRGTSNVGLASTTRTNQVIRWEAPNWNGFDGTIAWSANPLTQGAGGASTGGDLGYPLPGTGSNSTQYISRKGQGWNINPRYTASNWMVEYSYWNAKGDINSSGPNLGTVACNNAAVLQTAPNASANGCIAAAGATAGQSNIQDDQRSDVLAGRVNWSNWTFGLAWNRSRTTNVASGLTSGDRSAWSLPISFTTGPHLFGFVYVKANDSKDVSIGGPIAASGIVGNATITPVSGADTGARLFTLTYQYELSKRTALGLTYSLLKNQANANYAFFYNSANVFGSANTGPLAGEKMQLVAGTIRHNF